MRRKISSVNSPVSDPADHLQRPSGAASPRRVILLADDDPNDIFLTRRLLGKAGVDHEIVSCCDGEEVVAYLQRAGPDPASAPPRPSVLFLDLKMPKLDGFAVLRWVRNQPAWRALPVIMLSGSEEPRDIRRANELGATAYLTKHPAPEVFAQLLARHAGA